MSISALVACLDPNPDLAAAALTQLRADPRFEIGAVHDGQVALALETPSPARDRRAWRWLGALPGVAHSFVMWVHLDPGSDGP